MSRVGQLLDPAADRLYILATLIGLTVRDVVPLWLTVALVGRDVLLAFTLPVLRRHGYGPLPVNFLGKAATFNLLPRSRCCCSATATDSLVSQVAHAFGWAFAIWGTALYWWAGVLYVVQVDSASCGRGQAGESADMKAVVMAGGEGTRLRPMTSSMPKPLLPVVNRPIMEHVLRLLKRHGLTETVVTVQFLASPRHELLRRRRGARHGAHYANEEKPLGTAGSVKNAEAPLKDDTFLVISGDALTDFDLTDLIEFHKRQGRARHGLPDAGAQPAGVRHHDRRRRRQGRALPGEAHLGPGLLRHREHRHLRDGARGLRLRRGRRVRRLVRGRLPAADEGGLPDLRLHRRGLLGGRRHARVLLSRPRPTCSTARSTSTSTASRSLPASGSPKAPRCTPRRCCAVRSTSATTPRSRPARRSASTRVLGTNVVVKSGAFLHRAVVHDNVYIGPQTNLRGCVDRQEHRHHARRPRSRTARSSATSASSVRSRSSPATSRSTRSRPIEAGAFVNTSVIWESRGPAHLFGPAASPGILNVEITPELAVRLAGAYATTLKKGSTVTTARDHSRGARALKRAVISALHSSAIDVRDLENVPLPVARQQTARGSAGGIMIRTTPGSAGLVDIMFFDERGRRPRPQAASASWTGCFAAAGVPPGLPRRDRRPASSRRASSTPTPSAAAARSTPPGSPRPG